MYPYGKLCFRFIDIKIKNFHQSVSELVIGYFEEATVPAQPDNKMIINFGQPIEL